MGELFSTKSLLEFLPDTKQTLSPQIPEVPPSPQRRFACFADLTTEIRLEIWKLTFPPYREINIAAQKRKTKRARPDTQYKRCTHHPITLFINRESRYETLLHYKSFIRDRMKGGKSIAKQTIYYQPKRDVLYVNLRSILGEFSAGEFDWVTSLKSSNGGREFLNSLENLQVRKWDWNEQIRQYFLKRELKLLRDLKGLRRLDAVFGCGYNWQYYVFDEEGRVVWKDAAECEEEGRGKVKEGLEEFLEGVGMRSGIEGEGEGEGKEVVVEVKRGV